MRNAYSILLGEYVEAVEVEHRDTVGFQIVCPCCRDAVFKVARTKDDRRSDFFSHHRSPPEVVADCELRVGSMSDAARAESTAVSRGQSLREFRKVLGDALDLDAAAQIPPEEIDEYRRTLRVPFAGRDGRALTVYLRTYVSALAGPSAEAFLDAYEFDLGRAGIVLDTAFARRIQKRIAFDLMTHVVAPHASKAFQSLMGHALQQYRRLVDDDMRRLGSYAGDHAEQLAGVSRILEMVYGLRRTGFAEMLVRHAQATERGLEVVGMRTFAEILPMHVFGTLMRLPYREMLQNHRAGRPMLEDVRFHAGLPLGTVRIGDPDRSVPRGMF